MNVLSRLNSWLGSLQLAWAVPAGNLPTSRPTSRGYMEFHVIKTTAIPKDLILHKFPLEILIEILDQVDVTDLPALASSCKVLRALAEPLLPTRAAKDPILGRHALVWAADTGNYRLLEIMLKLGVDPNAAWYSLESWVPCSLGRAITAQGGGHRAMGPRRHEDLKAEMANEIASRGFSLCTRHRMRTDLVQYGSLVIKPESAVEWAVQCIIPGGL
ncbi:hypothetical protein V8F06_003391 [Rhypophila decipiens]